MKYENFVTPAGTAFYPNLRTPNMFEGNDLGFDCRVIFSEEDTEKMSEHLHKELAKAASLPEFAGKNLDAPDSFMGIGETKDGDMFFKFKTKSTYTTKAGETLKRVIPIFDSNGKTLPKNVDIGHGSTVRVSYTIAPYYKSRKIKGIALYLNAVQVIKLVKRGEQGADSFGFGTVAGGYVSDEVADGEIPFGFGDDMGTTVEGADF